MKYEYVISFVAAYGKDMLYNIISKDTQYYIGATILDIWEDVVHFETNQVVCFIETSQISALTVYQDSKNKAEEES